MSAVADVADSWLPDAAGWVPAAQRCPSPNCNDYPAGEQPHLLVVHAISLPPGQFGGPGVEQLFTNTLDPDEHPYYRDIHTLRVSAHFFIRRNGALLQFVPVTRRAWHAGVSSWKGRAACNDFSIGVELEGCDDQSFDTLQYQVLARLVAGLRNVLPLRAIAGHEHVAPGRKTDPGSGFDWAGVLGMDAFASLESPCDSLKNYK